MSHGDDPELNPYAAPVSQITKERGIEVSQYIDYAGFWRRFCAYFIDQLILGMLGLMILILTGVVMGLTGNTEDPAPFIFLAYLLVFILVMVYFPGMESSSYQATFGKMAMGVRVTDLYGQRISFGRSAGRFLGKLISGILLIGYLMAAFSEKKQALHDIMAGTLVLRTR